MICHPLAVSVRNTTKRRSLWPCVWVRTALAIRYALLQALQTVTIVNRSLFCCVTFSTTGVSTVTYDLTTRRTPPLPPQTSAAPLLADLGFSLGDDSAQLCDKQY